MTGFEGFAAYAAYAAAAVSAVGAYQQGKQQQATAEYNATIASKKALEAQRAGASQAAAIRAKQRQIAGRATAQGGASGIFGGSQLDIFAASAYNGEIDAQQALLTGETNANALAADSEFFRFKGDVASSNANWSVAGTMLGAEARFGQSDFYRNSGTQSPAPIENRNN